MQEAIGNGALLSQDWGMSAQIGGMTPDKAVTGFVDEFYIYTKALSLDEIQQLVKACTYGELNL